MARRNDFHHGVVIGNAAGIQSTGRNQPIHFRPVPLQTAGFDAIDFDAAMKLAQFVPQHNRIAVAQSQATRILRRHDNIVTPQTGQRIKRVVHNAVELFSAPRGKKKVILGQALLRQFDG